MSRRARPFAASGAPCLTFNLPAPLCLLRPRQRRTDRLHPQISRQHRLGKCVVGGARTTRSLRRDRDAASSTGQGGTGSPAPYRIASRADPTRARNLGTGYTLQDAWRAGGSQSPRLEPPETSCVPVPTPFDPCRRENLSHCPHTSSRRRIFEGPPALPFHWPALASRPPEAAVARGR